MPPLAGIATPEDARAYWAEHPAGKTISLHVKEPKSGIIPSLTNPWRLLSGRDGRHLYLGTKIGRSDAYFVVVEVTARGACSFVTAQHRPMAATQKMARSLVDAMPGDLPKESFQKANSPPFLVEGGGNDPVLGGTEDYAALEEGPAAAAATRADRPVVAAETLELFYSFFRALPPGARWITVRPNGPGTNGHPILIQPAGDGAYRVIGGAGSKLNDRSRPPCAQGSCGGCARH